MSDKISSKQAQRILDRFGGARKLARYYSDFTGEPLAPSVVYRWTYPQERGGTDGMIPGPRLQVIIRMAEFFGIDLTKEDLAGL